MIQGRRVFIAEYHVDLRFGTSRLMGLAFQAGLNPREGDVIVFGGRNRKRLKVLHGDATGVWLSCKMFLENDSSCLIKSSEKGELRTISMAELAWLIDGRKTGIEK